MEEIIEFSITRKSDTDSTLLFKEKPCVFNVLGVNIEKQYKLSSGFFLIFTTDDCPYEESLHILLLNDHLDLVDAIDIGVPYTSALLQNIRVISSGIIEFDFYVDVTYQLSVDISGTGFYLTMLPAEASRRGMLFRKKYLGLNKITKKENHSGK